MRLTCDVDVANRLLPSFNMKGKGKSVRSQLSVGKKLVPTGEKISDVYLMICTKQNINGSKYKLQGNIEKFFTKFVSEGKATIRFKEPPHDICLSKADPMQLKGLLSVVRMGCQGQGLEKVTLTTLAPPSVKQAENKFKTRLTISTKRDYPITSNFPGSLEVLNIHECSLKRVDTRILQLKKLVRLDLSHNHLRSLPDDFSTTAPLSELVLAHNQLDEVSAGFTSGSLGRTLTLLDLSHNKLKVLRPAFCQLTQLSTLRLDNNQLAYLPAGLGRLQLLRHLSASDNQLRTLPGTLAQLRLDQLDLGQNPFLEDGPHTPIDRLQVPTLLEWAARAINRHKIPYTEEDVGPLMAFLSSGRRCLCGALCFLSHVHYLARVDLRRLATSVTAIDTHGRTHAPCEAFLCSQICFNRYKKNPHATIWK